MVTFVRHCTFKPSFFSPSSLPLHSILPPAHCLNSPGDILCCNLKTRGQEIKCKRISLKPIGALLQHLLLFSDPILLFLISSPCLPRPPLCSGRNVFVVYLHPLIADKDKPDASPSRGQSLCPFVNETLWECLSTDVRNWRLWRSDSRGRAARPALMWHRCQDTANQAL